MYTVYILANGRRTTFYVGVTNDLARRMAEHRAASDKTFVGVYNVQTRVYVEQHAGVRGAIEREKRLKRWRRAWKLDPSGSRTRRCGTCGRSERSRGDRLAAAGDEEELPAQGPG